MYNWIRPFDTSIIQITKSFEDPVAKYQLSCFLITKAYLSMDSTKAWNILSVDAEEEGADNNWSAGSTKSCGTPHFSTAFQLETAGHNWLIVDVGPPILNQCSSLTTNIVPDILCELVMNIAQQYSTDGFTT